MNSRMYYQQLVHLRDGLDDFERKIFDEYFLRERKNPTHAFVISQFLGDYGIDRIALGQLLPGILKLITLGGLGIWTLIDYFLIGGSARSQNLQRAHDFVAALKEIDHDGK